MAKKKQSETKFEFVCKEIKRFSDKLPEIISSQDISLKKTYKTKFHELDTRITNAFLEISESSKSDIFYEDYVELSDILINSIATIETSLSAISNCDSTEATLNSKLKADPRSNINLPKFDLPQFFGDASGWINFKEIFLSSIGDNSNLTDLEKQQYLRSAVKGDAARLIKGFPISEGNYEQAWNTLIDRFDNPRELAFAQMSKIFSIKPMKNACSKSLLNILDICNESLRNLETLGFTNNEFVDLILIYFLHDKIEDSIRQQWLLSLENKTVPSYKHFIQFLEKHAQSMKPSKEYLGKEENSKSKRSLSYNAIPDNSNASQNRKCVFCHGDHALFKCQDFVRLHNNEKWDIVKKNKLCFNCLRTNHDASNCKITTRCKNCSKKHHSILHNSDVYPRSSSENQTLVKSQKPENSASLSLSGVNQNSCHILLSTAIVNIKDSDGQFQECRVLLDNGSQMSLITDECCRRLNLTKTSSKHVILGTGNHVAERSDSIVNLEFTSYYDSEKFFTKALVVKNLTSNLPNFTIRDPNWFHIKNLQLADPDYHISRPVDVILGADVFFDLILGHKRRGKHNSPSAIKSKLGWILSGKIDSNTCDIVHSNTTLSKSCNSIFSHHSSQNVDELLPKFWELESMPGNIYSDAEEQVCDKLYSKTVKRDDTGRYIVKLPFKAEPQLGNSRSQAVRRLISLERKFQSNPELKAQYIQFMAEYLKLNHMEIVEKTEIQHSSSHCYYMPHHGVIREHSTTTKLRVVFDASAKTTSNYSLNDFLHSGPKLQLDLFYILLRFRTHPVVLTADVEKMFRQIRVAKEDTDFQRIVWRQNPDDPIEDYKVLTIPFGLSCAPYLAVRTINQLAEDEKEYFPKAATVIKSDFYVDDLLTGSNSKEEAAILMYQLIELLQKGGFQLRKWISNEPSLLANLPEPLRGVNQPKSLTEESQIKILGIHWNPVTDVFSIDINFIEEVKSKRQLLSNISKIFDPLGFLSPTVILTKLLIQELWIQKVSWDEPLPNCILTKWKRLSSELKLLKQVQVSRYFKEKENTVKSVQIHGFCDASQKAYAAVLYMKVIFQDCQTKVTLIAAKTKVSPMKAITLPRLELCAALLLSQLFNGVINCIAMEIHESFLWTDSQIVLDWIKSDPNRWKTFVSNRLIKIQGLTSKASWNHVSGKENPADCASRGLMPSKLIEYTLWWEGPVWLKDSDFVIDQSVNCKETNENFHFEEIIKDHNSSSYSCQIQNPFLLIEKYSSYTKLIRITAWLFRFTNNSKTKSESRIVGPLTSSELEFAMVRIVKNIQHAEFATEIQSLQSKGNLPSNSPYFSLNPFLDENSILRVGGRLKYSSLPSFTKYPILLPKNHYFTQLVIEYFHKISLHSGTSVVLSLIRQKFWIPSGRQIVKKTIRKCIPCFKTTARAKNQLMGNLPRERITVSRPFQKTGLDFAGPITTKPNLKRSKVTMKSYIALFICFATKAVHLEVVSDLSAEAFLASLRRFLSRRGKPSDIFCDNATNFKGAKNYLQSQFQFIKAETIQNISSENAINWHFIPPSAPHFGGLWESNIKSMKQHMKRVCNSAILNFEELSTLVIQIESCLNSRPLTPLSSDPEDFEPLTPGHFLIGTSLLALPESNSQSDHISYSSRWKLIQDMRVQFWRRWSTEYLTQLQHRTKWTKTIENIQVGQLVLIRDESKLPLRWTLGRVTRVYPGDDGLVRVLQLKTPSGLYKRPVTKICPLPT